MPQKDIFLLTFDSTAIGMICHVLCNLHTISNNYAKYEHPCSKNKEGVRVTSNKLIVSIFDLVF